MKTFGKVIKDLRKEDRWTQRRLAKTLGISQVCVHRWENHEGVNPSFRSLLLIAEAFGKSLSVFDGCRVPEDRRNPKARRNATRTKPSQRRTRKKAS